MRKRDIQIGSTYQARIGDRTVSVRVDRFHAKWGDRVNLSQRHRMGTRYECTVIETGEKHIFENGAALFIGESGQCPSSYHPGCWCSSSALEPNDDCYIHGYPDTRKCPFCGQYRGAGPCRRCGCSFAV